jgi:hypothetical protein
MLTQSRAFLSGDWDEGYWREPLPNELSAAIKALRAAEQNKRHSLLGLRHPMLAGVL